MSNIISNPVTDVSNILATSGVTYVSTTPTWNPDIDSKKARIAINETTNEIWLWDKDKGGVADGAWVLYGLVARATAIGAPSHTPTNLNEIVLDGAGKLWAWDPVGLIWVNTSSNIYTDDGTLDSNRTINGATFNIDWDNLGTFRTDATNYKVNVNTNQYLAVSGSFIPTLTSSNTRLGSAVGPENITGSLVISNSLSEDGITVNGSVIVANDIHGGFVGTSASIASSILTGYNLCDGYSTVDRCIISGNFILTNTNNTLSTNTLSDSVLISPMEFGSIWPDTLVNVIYISGGNGSGAFNNIDQSTLTNDTTFIGNGNTTTTILAGDLRLGEGQYPVSGGYANAQVLGTDANSVVIPKTIFVLPPLTDTYNSDALAAAGGVAIDEPYWAGSAHIQGAIYGTVKLRKI